jgi:hypothetical protein
MIIHTKQFKVNEKRKQEKARREFSVDKITDRKAFLETIRTNEKAKHERKLELLPFNDLSNFFGISGVYFLYMGNKLVYVGESVCIITRLMQHQDKKFDSFKYIFEPDEQRRLKLERQYIKDHAPMYNIVHNPMINGQKSRVVYKTDLSQINID